MNDKADTKVSQGQFKQDIVRCCAQRRNQHKTENNQDVSHSCCEHEPDIEDNIQQYCVFVFPDKYYNWNIHQAFTYRCVQCLTRL